MSTKKVSYDPHGKQISHALYNLNLGTNSKDILPKQSPSMKPLSRVPTVSPPNRSRYIDDPLLDIKNKSPIATNTGNKSAIKDVRKIKSPIKIEEKEIPPRSGQKRTIPTPISHNKTKENEIKSPVDDTLANVQNKVVETPDSDYNKTNNENDPNMANCKICGRRFLPERLEAHERACSKINTKKRKPFVARKEIEGQPIKAKQKTIKAPTKAKTNWRKTHEEFVANIRAAREAQKILDAGGSLADLPPPPPSDTSHLTPCPHCGRKFSESAAARHIPLCKEKAIRAKMSAPRGGSSGARIRQATRLKPTRGAR